MNTTERELLQECHQLIDKNLTFINGTDNLLQKIEVCLAKPVQEPIGTVRQTNGCTYVEWNHIPPEDGTVCYAAPQSREPSQLAAAAQQGFDAATRMAQKQNREWLKVDAAWQAANTKNLKRIAELEKQSR